eukprot:m.204622 g.204622  ORF g.204622 m.204622 type:complete len:582 (-) comp22593_c0_seq1:66-1811(-)
MWVAATLTVLMARSHAVPTSSWTLSDHVDPDIVNTVDISDLALPSFLADHMVLQRHGATLWGRAAPHAHVTVHVVAADNTTLADNITTVDDNGAWRVAVSLPATLDTSVTVRSTSGGVIVLRDVAWGDVFLCSGQSNAEYPVTDAFYGQAEQAAASHPSLRLLNLQDVSGPKNASFATDCPSKAPYTWAASAPATITPRSTSGFGGLYPSAICWFAMRDTLLAQPSVPLGLITAAVSGSPIELWMPAEAILDGIPAVYGGNGTCGGTAVASSMASNTLTRPPATHHSLTTSCPAGGVTDSGRFFRGMIAPLIPMRLTGVMWYQGEENDHPDDACPGPTFYKCLFPAMIQYWRKTFAIPNLPFFYVLLAGGHTAVMREAQVAGASALPHTAFASAMDLSASGNEYLVPGHSPRKQEVGRRLSLAIRSMVYNDTSLETSGPTVMASSVKVVVTPSSTTVTIPLDPGANGHVHFNGTGGCSACCNGSSLSAPVGVMDHGAPKPVVVKADSYTLDTSTAVLTAVFASLDVSGTALEVQFQFDNFPQCAVYNGQLSGPDSVYAATPHFGLVANSWRGNVTVSRLHW